MLSGYIIDFASLRTVKNGGNLASMLLTAAVRCATCVPSLVKRSILGCSCLSKTYISAPLSNNYASAPLLLTIKTSGVPLVVVHYKRKLIN